MRDIPITFSPEDLTLLARVRQQQGLASDDQAAEWLIKSSLRKSAMNLSGRGRALYDVDRKPTCE
jgi:hypothetical protein